MIRRLLLIALIAAVLLGLVAQAAPQELPVLLYKLLLLFTAGTAGFFLDWLLFPYARPGDYLIRPWQSLGDWHNNAANFPVTENYYHVFSLACLCRAAIIVGAMLAVGLGA